MPTKRACAECRSQNRWVSLIETVAPGFYRSAFITRALNGMTLWEFLRADDDPVVRAHVVELARRAIDTMHDAGLLHADLNLHNLFVSNAGERMTAVILDLDKAQLFDGAVPLRAAGARTSRA